MKFVAKVAIWTFLLATCISGHDLSAAQREPALSPQQLASAAKRSVVVVECPTGDGSSSLGSGFSVDVDLIATNAHVISECSEIFVRPETGRAPTLARAVFLDVESDLAILYVQGLQIPSLPLAVPAVRQGQKVYAMGHPEGLEFTVSDGIVSAIREFGAYRLIQTTAPISHGSSGGPLLDTAGRVVGMTTLTLKEGQNLNFAVPADAVRTALYAARGYLKTSVAGRTGEGLTPIMTSASAARMAHSLWRKRQYARATEIVDAALKKDPGNVELMLQRAEVQYSLGQKAASEALVRSILQTAPKFAPAHFWLGWILVYGSANGAEEGCREGQRALDLDPDEEYEARTHVLLWECEGRRVIGAAADKVYDYVENALAHIDAALRYDEFNKDPTFHLLRAISLRELGRKAEANREARFVLSHPGTTDGMRQKLKEHGLPMVTVRVVSHAPSNNFLSDVVEGVVVNDGEETVSYVRVGVECKDSDGKIIGTGWGYVDPTTLKPEESGSFQVFVKGPMNTTTTCKSKVLEAE
jgi:Trypsin-like peptidase domain/Tetratricopeptide repeat